MREKGVAFIFPGAFLEFVHICKTITLQCFQLFLQEIDGNYAPNVNNSKPIGHFSPSCDQMFDEFLEKEANGRNAL